MDWERDLADWPNRELSRQIRHYPCDWHVQIDGEGPDLILLHGAGGSVHSWRDCIPLLARSFRVIAIDLPGHGFSRTVAPHRTGLTQMAQDVLSLCEARGWRSDAILAHSAGAALALEMSRISSVRTLVAINPALAPFRGLAALLFPAAARFLSTATFAIDGLARAMATNDRIEAILAGTGSKIDASGKACYRRLFQNRDHLVGTITMMANWRLEPLLADLPNISTDCLFLCGGRDRTVPPDIALDAARNLPSARVEVLEPYGHLLHEEVPETVCDWTERWLAAGPVTAPA